METKEFSYQIIRSDRKTIAIQITPQAQVVVRCPRKMRDREVAQFVESKSDWIRKHLPTEVRCPQPPLSLEEIQELANRALSVIPERVAYFAPKVGVTYGRITIRNQRSRWGSCSGKGDMNFNCLLMLAPPEVLDYVVVHELCHRKQLNHSPEFWAEVARVMPDYSTHRNWLKQNGSALIGRMQPDPCATEN